MKNAKTNIFLETASQAFYEKLDLLHELFIECILLTGVCKNGSMLEKIPFQESETYSSECYKMLIYLMKTMKPNFSCRLLNKKRLEVECLFYDFSSDITGNQVYMIQNVIDWTSKKNFCCQVWMLQPEVTTQDMIDYWRA